MTTSTKNMSLEKDISLNQKIVGIIKLARPQFLIAYLIVGIGGIVVGLWHGFSMDIIVAIYSFLTVLLSAVGVHYRDEAGDWAAGYMATTLKLDPGTGFGWAAAPGTKGVFMMLSDSFGLPKGCKNREACIAWLKVCGSKEGSDAFNPLKGSISARKDTDLSLYNAYLKSAAQDWASNRIVGSLAHGVAANETFMNDFFSWEKRTSLLYIITNCYNNVKFCFLKIFNTF